MRVSGGQRLLPVTVGDTEYPAEVLSINWKTLIDGLFRLIINIKVL